VQDEVHYFDKNYFLPLRWYRNHFVRSDGSLLNGEATPVYMSKKSAIDRIRVHYPDVKLIVFLREPIQRAFSKWNRVRQRNDAARVATKPFVRSVLDNDRKLLTNGLYAEHLEYILKRFPRENLHIAISERVLDRPAQEYERISRFLDLAPFDFGASERRHSTTYKSDLKETDVKLLFDRYAAENERFYELMDERIDEWEGFYRHHGLA